MGWNVSTSAIAHVPICMFCLHAIPTCVPSPTAAHRSLHLKCQSTHPVCAVIPPCPHMPFHHPHITWLSLLYPLSLHLAPLSLHLCPRMLSLHSISHVTPPSPHALLRYPAIPMCLSILYPLSLYPTSPLLSLHSILLIWTDAWGEGVSGGALAALFELEFLEQETQNSSW